MPYPAMSVEVHHLAGAPSVRARTADGFPGYRLDMELNCAIKII